MLAPNPGPMTLDGTNTYVVGAGVVVDPGPVDQRHAARIAALGMPTLIMLTHRHVDHSASAARLAAEWAVPVRAADPALCVGAAPLTDATVITAGAGMDADTGVATVTVITTPGHTDDSICLLVEDPGEPAVLLSGDTILGRGTSVITHPQGDVGAYLHSLDRLERIVTTHHVETILPGHGPVITDPAATIAAYRDHRHARLDQVRAALARGARSPEEIVALVYADIDPAVGPAALQSVRAQLDHLRS